jgi:hypothetical protein
MRCCDLTPPLASGRAALAEISRGVSSGRCSAVLTQPRPDRPLPRRVDCFGDTCITPRPTIPLIRACPPAIWQPLGRACSVAVSIAAACFLREGFDHIHTCSRAAVNQWCVRAPTKRPPPNPLALRCRCVAAAQGLSWSSEFHNLRSGARCAGASGWPEVCAITSWWRCAESHASAVGTDARRRGARCRSSSLRTTRTNHWQAEPTLPVSRQRQPCGTWVRPRRLGPGLLLCSPWAVVDGIVA